MTEVPYKKEKTTFIVLTASNLVVARRPKSHLRQRRGNRSPLKPEDVMDNLVSALRYYCNTPHHAATRPSGTEPRAPETCLDILFYFVVQVHQQNAEQKSTGSPSKLLIFLFFERKIFFIWLSFMALYSERMAFSTH